MFVFVAGLLVPAGLLIAVGYVGCDQVAAVVLLTLSTGMLGVVNAGALINHLDIAPSFAGKYIFEYLQQFSVPQIEYPLVGSSRKGSHVYFLLQFVWVILLFDTDVVLMLPW